MECFRWLWRLWLWWDRPRRRRVTPSVEPVSYVFCPVWASDAIDLDAFRDEVYRHTGERPSRQHAVGRLLQFALEHKNLAEEVLTQDGHLPRRFENSWW